MVVRLYGTCNGQPVEFNRTEEDLWVAQVPKLPSGEYIVDLIAEDEAGNKGYFLKALLTYTIFGLKIRVLNPAYKSVVLEKNFRSVLSPKYLVKGVSEVDGKEIFILGEERYVSFEVLSLKGEEFTILKGTWELFLNGEVESSGEARIDGHLVSALVRPKTKYNAYSLVFTYLIGSETLKTLVRLEVIDPK